MSEQASEMALKILTGQNDNLRKLVTECVKLASTAPIIQFDPQQAAARGEVHVIQYLYQLEEWMKQFNRLQKKMNIVAPDILAELVNSGCLAENMETEGWDAER